MEKRKLGMFLVPLNNSCLLFTFGGLFLFGFFGCFLVIIVVLLFCFFFFGGGGRGVVLFFHFFIFI